MPAVALLAGLTFLGAGQSARAATITKADTNTLSTSGVDWTGAVAPGPFDIAFFDTTISALNIGNLNLATNLTWQGLTLGTTNGAMVINAGNTLTLGTAGINMSAATTT